MQKLTLKDFLFSEVDHCYYSGDFMLAPTFGGFAVFINGEQYGTKPFPHKEALELINELRETNKEERQ